MSEQERNEKKGRKPSSSKTRRMIKILLIALGIVALAIVGRYIYVMFINPMSAFDKPQGLATPSPVIAATPESGNTPAPTPVPTPTLSPEEALKAQADMEFMKNKVNILMLGWDQSPEREDEDSALYRDEDNNFRSDVLILLTIDFSSKRVDMISIPRDTYAPIYNTKGRWKINAAFAKGGSVKGDGFTYAMNTVGDLLGVPIEYYAGVDMIGLKNVVDAMGGVDYDVDVKITLNGRVLEKGQQHLNGQQVLDYCRARKGISTDVGRADRQQRMLFSIFEQLKSRNQLVNVPNIYNSVKDDIHTNLNAEQIAALAVFAMQLDMGDLNRHTLQGEYISDVYNASFYVLYNSKLKSLVKEIYGIDIQPNPKYDVKKVKSDKAATSISGYISGADYLLSAFGGLSGAGEVQSAKDDLQAAASAATSDGDVDVSAIESAKSRLYSAMYNLCMSNGLTQAQISKGSIPSGIYNALPAGTADTATPDPGTATPSPQPDIPDTTIVDPAA